MIDWLYRRRDPAAAGATARAAWRSRSPSGATRRRRSTTPPHDAGDGRCRWRSCRRSRRTAATATAPATTPAADTASAIAHAAAACAGARTIARRPHRRLRPRPRRRPRTCAAGTAPPPAPPAPTPPRARAASTDPHRRRRRHPPSRPRVAERSTSASCAPPSRSSKHYPTSREARQLRPEGTVRVWIELDRTGQLLGSGVDAGSGSPILDSEAPAHGAAGRYTALPARSVLRGRRSHRFVVLHRIHVAERMQPPRHPISPMRSCPDRHHLNTPEGNNAMRNLKLSSVALAMLAMIGVSPRPADLRCRQDHGHRRGRQARHRPDDRRRHRQGEEHGDEGRSSTRSARSSNPYQALAATAWRQRHQPGRHRPVRRQPARARLQQRPDGLHHQRRTGQRLGQLLGVPAGVHRQREPVRAVRHAGRDRHRSAARRRLGRQHRSRHVRAGRQAALPRLAGQAASSATSAPSLRVDTGKIGNFKAFISYSKAEVDKWKGNGKADRDHVDAGVDYDLGKGSKLSADLLYNHAVTNNFRTPDARRSAPRRATTPTSQPRSRSTSRP